MVSQLRHELKRSKYRILGLVGQGQFGRVYCAVHRQTGRLVALKNLEHQRFSTHKFLRELRFLLSLQHPNIVTCQALEHTSTGRCLVMDYCEGGTLRGLIDAEVCLSLPQSLKLVADVLAGLEHAHSRGIVHCDIKPENILLSCHSTGWTARISDFGIARLSQELANLDAGNTGSPAYMAPERFYGQYSLTSDLYSVGILLFELLAGHRPFSGTPAELMSAHLNSPVKLPDTIPEVWRSLITTALQKLSARRFHSASEMLTALKAIAAQEGSGSWLDPNTVHLPLLKPTDVPTPCPFSSQQQELLRQPITALAVLEANQQQLVHAEAIQKTYLYRSQEAQITFQLYPTGILQDSSALAATFQQEVWHLATLEHPVQELLTRPQGCFAISPHSVHLMPWGIEADASLASHWVATFADPVVATIDARGRWLAIATPHPELGYTLSFQALPGQSGGFLSPDPMPLAAKAQAGRSLRLFALDGRRVAVLSTLPPQCQVKGCTGKHPGTLLEVWTRRGNCLGSLSIPLRLGAAYLTTKPYQLIALDQDNPQSVLLIDLKPFRILRLGIDIQPDFLAVTAWGYILANRQGQILVLDQQGQQINRIESPAPLTAIAPCEGWGLLLATWNDKQGSLYTVDLKELGLEIMF